jgi:hypothetical protein
MSRRPHIQHPHEHRIEAAVQKARAKRERRMARASAKPGDIPPPLKFDQGRGPSTIPIPPEVKRWIAQEARAQRARYDQIGREMAKLAPLRDQWAREFYERITGPRGFSVHAGQRRTIRQDEIAARPKRPWRVLW